jgi:hypothetical protein
MVVRQRMVAADGLTDCRYGERTKPRGTTPSVRRRSKLMSELVPESWWISTATTLVPLRRAEGFRVNEWNVVVSSVPVTALEAGVVAVTVPAGIFVRATSVPLR